MLLRRLGLALKSHWPDDAVRPPPTGPGRSGIVTPVATSATLGDEGDPAAMLDFARTVFGEDFGADAVVTESRLSLDEWLGAASHDAPASHRPRRRIEHGRRDRVAGRSPADASPSACSPALFADEDGTAPMLGGATARRAARPGQGAPVHPRAGPSRRARPASLDDLVDAVLPSYAADDASRDLAEQMLLLLDAPC